MPSSQLTFTPSFFFRGVGEKPPTRYVQPLLVNICEHPQSLATTYPDLAVSPTLQLAALVDSDVHPDGLILKA